jgi:hypothetical protein
MTVNPVNKKPLTGLFQNTLNIQEYLTETVNVPVVSMWECEWQALKKTDPSINQFLDNVLARTQPSYAKLFKKKIEVVPDVYEVSNKKQTRWDLPLQIGLFAYQYGELLYARFLL